MTATATTPLSAGPQASDSRRLHPSRTAPVCAQCKHLTRDRWCNHPAVPVSIVTGWPVLTAANMRGHTGPGVGTDVVPTAYCGAEASLFEARPVDFPPVQP